MAKMNPAVRAAEIRFAFPTQTATADRLIPAAIAVKITEKVRAKELSKFPDQRAWYHVLNQLFRVLGLEAAAAAIQYCDNT